MTGTLVAYSLLIAGSLLDLQTLPWSPGTATCFVADSNGDGRAEVFVADPKQLQIYGRGRDEALLTRALPPGLSALDVADVDRDGTVELVAVVGNQLLSFSLSRGTDTEPKVLFECENQYSHAGSPPFPCTLIVEHEGGPAIALPQRDALEVRRLDGALVERYPIDVRTPQHLSISRPFSYWINQHAQSGPQEALEFRVSSIVSYRPLAAGDVFAPADERESGGRAGTLRQQREAIDSDPEGWPWFEIGVENGTSLRALYRIAQPHPPVSAVRLRRAPEASAGEIEIGPSRNYPGTMLLPGGSSGDFNGDGYADIVLWKARQPSLSADGLARAAVNGTWPISITTHLYMPEKRRFQPRPHGHLVLELPIAWWLSSTANGPFREVLFQDFNGDGKDDFSCLTAEDTLAVWTVEDDGFEAAPAFQHRFAVPVTRVLLVADLEGRGASTVILECGATLQVLRPQTPLSDFQP